MKNSGSKLKNTKRKSRRVRRGLVPVNLLEWTYTILVPTYQPHAVGAGELCWQKLESQDRNGLELAPITRFC